MAQPAAIVPVPRLFPVFPQEISLMILEHLEIFDLVTLYFLNPNWTKMFDSDNTIRQMMFRLPREKTTRHADDTERTRWVNGLWEQTYKKIQNSEHKPKDFWAHIRVNPYLEVRPIDVSSTSIQHSVEDTYCMFGGPCRATIGRRPPDFRGTENPTDQYLELPKEHKTQAQALIRSMFVSYPPVTRTELYGRTFGPRIIWARHIVRTSSESWQESQGYKMGQVYEIARRQPRDVEDCMTRVKLWPGMLWRIKHGIPLENVGKDEEEADRTDDATGGVGVNEGQIVGGNVAEPRGEEGQTDEAANNGILSEADSSLEEDDEEEEEETSEDDEDSEYEPQSDSDDSD